MKNTPWKLILGVTLLIVLHLQRFRAVIDTLPLQVIERAPERGLEEFLYIFSFPFIYPIFDFIDVPRHVRGKITAFGKIPAHFQIRRSEERRVGKEGKPQLL